jgi:hypothetical protein
MLPPGGGFNVACGESVLASGCYLQNCADNFVLDDGIIPVLEKGTTTWK